MPLKKGSSRKIISTNIKEFHTGKTYAHTASKFGKERANKQAIAVALNTARRFSKRASGGKVKKYANEGAVEPNPEFDPSLQRVYINPPPPPPVPISGAPEGYQPEPAQPVRPSILDYIQPREDFQRALREQAEEYPAYLHEQGQENIQTGHPGKMLLGAGQEILGAAMPAIAPIGAAAETVTKGIGRLAGPAFERMADVGSWIGPGAAEKSVLAGLGFTAAGAKNVSKINDAVFKAVEAGGEPNKEIFTAIKQHYPKDVAQSAYYLGLGPEDVGVLKQYMLPGAQAAFDKHYLKLMKKAPKQPLAEPMKEGKLLSGPDEWFENNLTHPEAAPPPTGISSKQFLKDAQYLNPEQEWKNYSALHDIFSSKPLPLSLEQKQAVGYWGTAEGYKDINGYLRGMGGSQDAVKAIQHLNEAMKATPLQQDMSVWRGLHGIQADELKKLNEGDLFFNKGYTATSIDPRRATHYGAKDNANVLLNYHLPAGQESLYISHPNAGNWIQNERELLLPHGQPFQIVGVEKIKAPVWHYMGDLKENKLREYTVYHVAPAQDARGAGQIDITPPSVKDGPHKPFDLEDKSNQSWDTSQHPIPEGWGQDLYQPLSEEGATAPKGGKTSFEEALLPALQSKYDKGGWKELDSFEDKSALKSAFDSVVHNIYDVSTKKILSVLSSVHADNAPISMHGIYGNTLKKYMDKFDAYYLLQSMSAYHLDENKIKNIFSYLSENKIGEIKATIAEELAHHGYTTPAVGSKLHNAIDNNVKLIDWKNYKAPMADPTPPELIAHRERIIKAGGNPDVALLKGGNEEGYPLQTPSKAEDIYSKTKGLFLGDEKKVAQSYGHVVGAPYVAVPRQKVVELDYGKLAKSLGEDNGPYGKFIDTIKYIKSKYDPEMMIAHNVNDWAKGGNKDQTQYIVFKTNILRAPHAEFDPEKWHLRLPLAGIAGLGFGAGVYTYGTGGAEAAEHKKDGGKVKKKHPQIDEDPQEHEFINFAQGGLIDSDIPGRTDKIPMKVAPGSYVLPADIPSALGQGNTKAGHEILKKMFTHSAYGLPPPNIKSRPFHYPQKVRVKAGGGAVSAEKVLPPDHQLGMRVPKGGSMCANCKYLSSPTTCGNSGFVKWNGSSELPDPANEYCCDLYESKTTEPEGKAKGGKSDHVPIVAAGGEYVIHPDVVKHIGHGDMTKGHKVLDKFVVHTRKQHIETLRKLKPPK